MLRSARTVGQLGAALALACLGLGVGTHPAFAVSGPYVTMTSDKCTTVSSCSFSSHSTASTALSVNLGDSIYYHLQVITDFGDINNYGGSTLNSSPASGFNFSGNCSASTDVIPFWAQSCTGPNPVKWSSVAAVPSHGNIYDFYYEVNVACGSASTVSTTAYFSSTSPPFSSGQAYEFAQVNGCGTPAVTDTNGNWSSNAYVGISSLYPATVTASGNPVTTGTVTFSYGPAGASCPSTGAVMNVSNVSSAGTASIYYAFAAAGTFTVFAWYYPPSGSSQYQPSCFSRGVTVLTTSGGTPTPGSGASTSIAVSWGNPVQVGTSQSYNAAVTSSGSPVTSGTLSFGYGGTPCTSGITNMGSASVNSHGSGSINYAFNSPGTYAISVAYAPIGGSLYAPSCTSATVTVKSSTTSTPTPTPGPTPTPTPSNNPQPSGAATPTPSAQSFVTITTVAQLPATNGPPAPTVALSTAAPAGNSIALSPPRTLPELAVLNSGTVLALSALNATPFIVALDVLAFLGLMWHLRRRALDREED